MSDVKAYKLDVNKESSIEGILVDFSVNDLCGSHKYYLVHYDGDVNVKKINSIDNLVEYLDRNSFETTEISRQSLSILVSTMEYYLDKNSEKTDKSSYKVPGTAPLNDFDKIFLKEYRNRTRTNFDNRNRELKSMIANDVNVPNKVSYTGGDFHGKK